MATRSLITEYVKDTDGNYNSVEIHPITDSASVLTTTTQESGKNYGSYTGLPLETGSTTTTQETVLQSLLKTRSRLYELRAFNNVTINTNGWSDSSEKNSVPSSYTLHGTITDISNRFTTMNNTLSSQIENTNTSINKLNTSVNELSDNIDDLDIRIKQLTSVINKHEGMLNMISYLTYPYINKSLKRSAVWWNNNDSMSPLNLALKIDIQNDSKARDTIYYKISAYTTESIANYVYNYLHDNSAGSTNNIEIGNTGYSHLSNIKPKATAIVKYEKPENQVATLILDGFFYDDGMTYDLSYEGLSNFLIKWGCTIKRYDVASSSTYPYWLINQSTNDPNLLICIENYK